MFQIKKIAGRASLILYWKIAGDDYIACLTGGDEHVGAVAVGSHDKLSGRSSVSVITNPGHRESEIAMRGAKLISEVSKATSVFIVGIHIDNITKDEIKEIVSVSEEMIEELAVIIQEGY